LKQEDVFANYKDLYEFTSKTTNDHIEFYKNKTNMSINDMFVLWKKLSYQAETFDNHDWTQNWKNWHENMPGFIWHKYEAKFLIQWYLTDVLETLITKLIRDFELKETSKQTELQKENVSELIKREVGRQIKLELSKQKRSTNNIS